MGQPIPNKTDVLQSIERIGEALGVVTAGVMKSASDSDSGETKGQLLLVASMFSSAMSHLAEAKTFIRKNRTVEDVLCLDINIPDVTPKAEGLSSQSDDSNWKYN